MLTVVLDTSVVVAAARSEGGASALLLAWLSEDRFGIVISPALIFEYEAVLRRHVGRGGWSDPVINEFLDFACFKGRHVQPAFRLRPALRDAGDEFLLDLAVAGHVDWVVTLNEADFVGSERFRVLPIRPGDFVRLLREKR